MQLFMKVLPISTLLRAFSNSWLGLRLRPPAPSFLPRITPPEGMIIGGRYIPGNVPPYPAILIKTVVSTSYWTILHDERHFSNPHAFIPERWIDSERRKERCTKAAWLPFSAGLRNCIGRPYFTPPCPCVVVRGLLIVVLR